MQKMRESAALTSIHFLQNDSVVIGGVRFLGTMLWTNYRLRNNRTQSQQMAHAEHCLNDHRLIEFGNGRFMARDALAQHEVARAWLQAELSMPFAGKTVVVSHHGPQSFSGNNPLSIEHVSVGFHGWQPAPAATS